MYQADIYSISDLWGYPQDGSFAPKTQDFANVAMPLPGEEVKTQEQQEVTRQVVENKGASKSPLVLLAFVVVGLWALSKV